MDSTFDSSGLMVFEYRGWRVDAEHRPSEWAFIAIRRQIDIVARAGLRAAPVPVKEREILHDWQ